MSAKVDRVHAHMGHRCLLMTTRPERVRSPQSWGKGRQPVLASFSQYLPSPHNGRVATGGYAPGAVLPVYSFSGDVAISLHFTNENARLYLETFNISLWEGPDLEGTGLMANPPSQLPNPRVSRGNAAIHQRRAP